MDLTPHEEKILELIKKHPEVVSDPEIRRKVAEKNSLSEKTLRNRIADFKKYGLLGADKRVISVQKTQQIINESDEIDLLAVWNILVLKKWLIFNNLIARYFFLARKSLFLKCNTDTKGIRTPAGRAQWISSPSP